MVVRLVRDQVARRKRLSIVFGEAKPTEQGVRQDECTEAKARDYDTLAVAAGLNPSKDSNEIQFTNEVWHSLVVRLVRDQEAAGSNPVTPTK